MSAPWKILVVEDENIVAMDLRASLIALGYEVTDTAGTAREAVDSAQRRKPDLVLMDINLPGINGVEAVRRILAARAETVAFLLSTYAVGDLPLDARSCGAVAYVNKEDFGPSILRELWDAGGDPTWQQQN